MQSHFAVPYKLQFAVGQASLHEAASGPEHTARDTDKERPGTSVREPQFVAVDVGNGLIGVDDVVELGFAPRVLDFTPIAAQGGRRCDSLAKVHDNLPFGPLEPTGFRRPLETTATDAEVSLYQVRPEPAGFAASNRENGPLSLRAGEPVNIGEMPNDG